MTFTKEERAYLDTQRIGRLATIAGDGGLQNNPVGFEVDEEGRIVIRGRALGKTRKFRNIRTDPHVAFVVDDVKSVDPWEVRCVEIPGTAQALEDVEQPNGFFSREAILITPDRVIAFGLGSD
ncbi:MAG: PPOX class F420-dependent oxidoreductase [Marmoricola sp.]